MRKISIVLIGIIGVTIGIQYIPKEEQKVLIEEELNNNNTSLAFYIEQEDGNYEESLSLPSTGYTLDTEKSICTNNTTPIWEGDRLYLDNLQNKGTSCYLYFKIYEPTAKDIILSHYDTVLTRSDFSTAVTDTTTGTIYKSLDSSQYDNDGEVYYFAGNPTDNWVEFGGYWWRIIRINGNGSIRMIYQGTSANTTGTDTQIGTSAFNNNYNDNAYVGYMYGTAGSSTYEATHTNTNNSTIKQKLDEWYANDSGLIKYEQHLDGNAGFCGDRTASTNSSSINNQGGIGTTTTYYGAYIRLVTNQSPSLKCTENDLYTINGSENGNRALIYPIGLIAIDEAAYAGLHQASLASNHYLYTAQNYWTLSPYMMNLIFYIFNNGAFGSEQLLSGPGFGVRPVINLKADVTITGSGTTTDPYRVEGA